MKRCEVWWVNFDNGASNKFLNRVQAVPLTGKTDRLYPSEALVMFEGRDSKAMAGQLATVSKARLFRRAGILSEEDMRKVEEAVNPSSALCPVFLPDVRESAPKLR